jgi:hypothetical protein
MEEDDEEEDDDDGKEDVITNSDICFICGASLSRLKNRLTHIKRCSKRYGVTGRDVKLNDDEEEFQKAPVASSATSNQNNPYTNTASATWHGDSSLDLRLQEQLPTNQTTAETATEKKQMTLKSFIQAPVRNLNSVLFAGARKMSKIADFSRNAKDSAKKAPAAAKGRRQNSFTRDYSKVREA